MTANTKYLEHTDISQQCCKNPFLQKPTILNKKMKHTKHISADDQCYFRGYCNFNFYAHFNQNLQSTKVKAVAEVEFRTLAGAIFNSFSIPKGICINISIMSIA